MTQTKEYARNSSQYISVDTLIQPKTSNPNSSFKDCIPETKQQLPDTANQVIQPMKPSPDSVIQRVPPSDQDWEAVKEYVKKLKKQAWVTDAFPVAQGSQEALKQIHSDGICRTIVLKWLNAVKKRNRTSFLKKFSSGDVADLINEDQKYSAQQAIFDRRNETGLGAPTSQQVDTAREFLTNYLSIGGSLLEVVDEDIIDPDQIIDHIDQNGFYLISVTWNGGAQGHALGMIKSGDDYYYMDPNNYELKGTSTVLEYVRRILKSSYGEDPQKRPSVKYGLRRSIGDIEGCFITTACVMAKNLPDDCEELVTLRHFRDKYLSRQEGGPEMIGEYYRLAPIIIRNIEAREDSQEIFVGLYSVIEDCVKAIHAGNNQSAFEAYVDMVQKLKKEYYA